jgi:uncharacterized protein (TIGR03083 family)
VDDDPTPEAQAVGEVREADDVRVAVARRSAEVVAALASADPATLRGPSALPGWSRLTIACHLRYGALALGRMTAATLAGAEASYYPEGRDRQRAATLEPDAGEAPADVVASLAAHSARLDRQWADLAGRQWALDVVEPAANRDLGAVPLARLALLRLTEVEVHGTDLDLGLADWSDVFVRVALPTRLGWLRARRSNHRAFDDRLEGSWLLTATDGPAHLVSVRGEAVDSRPAAPTERATAVIEASSRDLLALLLGRPLRRPAVYRGDEAFGRAFSRAFPGP